ncbi:hypothetical protein C8F01DRAFT_1249675 [Mycena amicta]|nr:hypothetical protein C8F01DRAFT_1249675 [Mycena amicta]
MATKLPSRMAKAAKIPIPLLPSITSAAEVIAAAAECAPFPYIKAVFGVVVLVLKAVEAMKKNREDMKELYETLEKLCKKLQIEETMKVVLQGVEQIRYRLLARSPKARIVAFVSTRPISEEIKDLQTKTATLLSYFNMVVVLDTNRGLHELVRSRNVSDRSDHGKFPLVLRKPTTLGSLTQKLNQLYDEATKKIHIMGADAPETLIALDQLAREYSEVGEYNLAKDIQQHLLRAYQGRRGDDHCETLNAMGNLAITYMHVGQLQDAEKLAADLVEKRIRTQPEGRLDKLDEAKQLQKFVYWERKESLGANNPDTLLTMASLGTTYNKLGRPKDAKWYQQRAIAGLGEDHPDSLAIMGNLAIACGQLKEYDEARQLKTTVLSKLQHKKGGSHPSTLCAMLNLASTYKDLDLPQESKELELSVFEQRKRSLGEDRIDTLACMEHLAESHYRPCEFEKLAELEVPLLAKYAGLFGEADRRTRRVMKNLSMTYRRLGNPEKAAALEARLQRAVA